MCMKAKMLENAYLINLIIFLLFSERYDQGPSNGQHKGCLGLANSINLAKVDPYTL